MDKGGFGAINLNGQASNQTARPQPDAVDHGRDI